MSAHTPGPWGLDGNLIEGPDGERVACITAYSRRTPKQKANARLIAAAPELLEALQLCRQHMYEHASNTADDAFERLCAAIAKATGETK